MRRSATVPTLATVLITLALVATTFTRQDPVVSTPVAAPTTTYTALLTTIPNPSTISDPAASSVTTIGTTAQPTTNQPATTTEAGLTVQVEAEQIIVAHTNALRVLVHVPPVDINLELRDYARNWAWHMAETGTFAHSDIGSLLDGWKVVGENLAQGSDPSTVVDELAGSPVHLEVMTGAAYTAGGVGVVADAEGQLWICQIFAGEILPTTTTLPEVTITTVTVPETTLPTIP